MNKLDVGKIEFETPPNIAESERIQKELERFMKVFKEEKVNHPDHYNSIEGIECIDVVRHFNFNIGNAIKYLWRYWNKKDPITDLKKAIWYIQDEIKRLENKK